MRSYLLVPAAFVASLAVRPAFGDGETRDARQWRVYDLAAVTTPRASFVTDRGPYPARADEVNDEARPLYGNETEATAYAAVDEVVAEIEAGLPRPGPGAQERSLSGAGSRLVALATPAEHRLVAEGLAAVERRALEAVVVDLLAIDGDVPAGENGVATAIASGSARVLAAARTSSWLGVRSAATTGTMAAYVQDYDVEVAQKSATVNPNVGIARTGLSFEAAVVRSGERLRVDLHAWIARLAGMRTVKTSRDDAIDVPDVDGAALHATMRVLPGAWTVASGTGSVLFAVRATVEPYDATVAEGLLLRGGTGAPAGPIGSDSFPVADLVGGDPSSGAPTIALVPSNYTPPAHELPEPAPVLEGSLLLDLVRRTDPEAWEREGASLEASHDLVRVRHDDARREEVRGFLRDVRERFVRPIRLRALVASVPVAAWSGVVVGGGLADALRDEGRGVVEIAGARVEGRASVRVVSGQRGGSTAGTRRSYVADYDPAIAEGAAIGNPIVQDVLDGISFAAAPHLTGADDAVAVDVRLDRSDWRGARSVPTVHGAVECPTLGILRFRGHRLVRLGSTVLLAAGVEDGRATLVLLSAAWDAP